MNLGRNSGHINNNIFSLAPQVLLLVYRHTLDRYRYGTEVRSYLWEVRKKEEKEKEQKWEERERKKLLAADAEQSRAEKEGWDGVKSHQDVCNSVPPAAAAAG